MVEVGDVVNFMNNELLATCSGLGYLEGDSYQKEPDALGTYPLNMGGPYRGRSFHLITNPFKWVPVSFVSCNHVHIFDVKNCTLCTCNPTKVQSFPF